MNQIKTIPAKRLGPIHADVVKSIQRWAGNRKLKVHRTLDILLQNGGTMRVEKLCYLVSLNRISAEPQAAIVSLTTNEGHAYGKVLKSDGDFVSILPQYLPIFDQCWPQA